MNSKCQDVILLYSLFDSGKNDVRRKLHQHPL
nr:MAG TPA: hypothetical protein [Bacteriophage sp.]